MMSLLSVTVKKAHYIGPQASQYNSYATLKLQNVKSTTVTVKGATPCWEQDFLFETNNLNTGLMVEVWNSGMIWDRAMGYHWIPLQTISYSNEEGNGQWLPLESDVLMSNGVVVGTHNPTGHTILVDCRFELPFDPDNMEASDLQRKLEMLNNIMDQEARMEQARRQMQYIGHSGYSEDSDYTSDLNYPVGQHANSSASQYRAVAHQIRTPQRSLETSRENSYERDDGPSGGGVGGGGHHLPAPPTTHHQHLSPGTHRRLYPRFSPGTDDYSYTNSTYNVTQQPYNDNNSDLEPLFYNSRPRNKTDYSSQRRKHAWDNQSESQETWVSCETSFYDQSIDNVDIGVSVDNYYQKQLPKPGRRPSLERQTTLYDDSTFYNDSYPYPSNNFIQSNHTDFNNQKSTFNQNQSCDEYYDSLSYPFQNDEDRQWDSGGLGTSPPPPAPTAKTKKLPSIPLQPGGRRRSSLAELCATPTPRRRMPHAPPRRPLSRQSAPPDSPAGPRGASLPPTPTRLGKALPRPPARPPDSLPATPGRQLPRPAHKRRLKRTASCDADSEPIDDYFRAQGVLSYNEKLYNEDYNYAYQSIDDDLHQPKLPHQAHSIDDDYFYNAQDYQPELKLPLANHIPKETKSSLISDITGSIFGNAVSSINNSINQLKAKTIGTPQEPLPPKVTILPTPTQPTRALLKQQNSIIEPITYPPILPNQESMYFEAQESIESYIEDDEDQYPYEDVVEKVASNHDSPSSVIHNSYDAGMRRGSSQITVVDPYHPLHDVYAASRRSSAADLRRASNEEPLRKPSLVVDHYPDENGVILEEAELEVEKKSVIFEEDEKEVGKVEEEALEEKAVQRPQVTAQQRWLWAYNKIIMQLNVSFYVFFVFRRYVRLGKGQCILMLGEDDRAKAGRRWSLAGWLKA